MNFAEMFGNLGETVYTENGAKAFSTTGSGALLDLFATIGGMRKREDNDIISMWRAAEKEDATLADNLILYSRNIRDGGLGERRIGRLLMRQLARLNPDKVKRNFQTIVDAGRWDDLFVFIGTPVESDMFKFIKSQIKSDVDGCMKNKAISICAKWLKSENTSSKESRDIAVKTRVALGLSPRNYRKMLSKLRNYLRVLEVKMSAGKWNEIDFESIPSVAMNRYVKAFNKRCQESFAAYKASLVKGEAKVNTATLYPYDLVNKILNGRGYDDYTMTEEQWKALPNYLNGEYDVVCLADVSGSMWGTPMATSIGLATYFAQHNKGAYHGKYLTFTSHPSFIKLEDHWDLHKCIEYVQRTGVGYSTDLDAAFEAIYQVARVTHDVPKALAVISDGEIDRWMRSGDYCASIAEKWKMKYAAIGLKAPKLILWNVESRGQTKFLAKAHENVAFVSGSSAGIFKNFIDLIETDAYTAMVRILSKPEFSWK